jgi:hypothetical protein
MDKKIFNIEDARGRRVAALPQANSNDIMPGRIVLINSPANASGGTVVVLDVASLVPRAP